VLIAHQSILCGIAKEYHKIQAFFCTAFGVIDVVSFDFQHLLANPHFSVIFLFQQIGSQTGALYSGIPVALTSAGNGGRLVDAESVISHTPGPPVFLSVALCAVGGNEAR
jgi:hypothetical protein